MRNVLITYIRSSQTINIMKPEIFKELFTDPVIELESFDLEDGGDFLIITKDEDVFFRFNYDWKRFIATEIEEFEKTFTRDQKLHIFNLLSDFKDELLEENKTEDDSNDITYDDATQIIFN